MSFVSNSERDENVPRVIFRSNRLTIPVIDKQYTFAQYLIYVKP